MSLLEVRAERARTESNVLQLANRIKLLERAEKNARKRIEKARSRAKTIEARREETAAARRRRAAAAAEAERKTLRLSTKLHVEKEQRNHEIERKITEQRERKRAMALTVKAQRSRGEKMRSKSERREDKAMRRRNVATRAQRDLMKTKRDNSFDQTTVQARQRYDRQVAEERTARRKVEAKERKLRRKEHTLLRSLQQTQIETDAAFSSLEDVLSNEGQR